MFTKLVKPPPYASDFCVLTKPKMVPLLLSFKASRANLYLVALFRYCFCKEMSQMI